MGIGRETDKGKEVSLKIVYWGAEEAGKTENILQLNRLLSTSGHLVTLVGEDGSTIYFDFLSPVIRLKNGCKVKYLLFASPGKEALKLARKLVIHGTDGIVFVVDSRAEKLSSNKASFSELIELLNEHRGVFGDIPIVVQYNKRDFPTALSIEELQKELGLEKYPAVEATAKDGIGVVETFHLIARESLRIFIKSTGLDLLQLV